MCMKNVNATMFMCSSIKTINGKVDSFEGIFDSVIPTREENQYFLDGLNIVIVTSIIFSSVDSTDCMMLDKEYEFMVRLTHVESGLGIPLHTFTLKLKQEDLRTWCKNFYELKRAIKFPRIAIPKGLGNYALKLLIRPAGIEEEGWTTQAIHGLVIGESC